MKLRDELEPLARWVTEPGDATRLAAEVQRVKTAWTETLFGPAREPSLRRYFNYQQLVLAELAGTAELAVPVLELQAFLQRYFQAYLVPDERPGEKLGLTLTVAQLALLIRLLAEQGVFAVSNTAWLLRFFAAHFSSKRQQRISRGSLNKLYYSGDQFTAAALRDLLLQMVARINQLFFPL